MYYKCILKLNSILGIGLCFSSVAWANSFPCNSTWDVISGRESISSAKWEELCSQVGSEITDERREEGSEFVKGRDFEFAPTSTSSGLYYSFGHRVHQGFVSFDTYVPPEYNVEITDGNSTKHVLTPGKFTFFDRIKLPVFVYSSYTTVPNGATPRVQIKNVNYEITGTQLGDLTYSTSGNFPNDGGAKSNI